MQLEIGKIYGGKITGITKFGAFVELEPGTTGMVHISEVANTFVNEIRDHLTEGQEVKVRVLTINDDGKISLSIKKAVDNPPPRRDAGAPPRRDFGSAPRKDFGGPPRRDFKRNDRKSDTWEPRRSQPTELTFEDMLSKFKQSSEEKQGDLKRIIDGKRKSGSRRPSGK